MKDVPVTGTQELTLKCPLMNVEPPNMDAALTTSTKLLVLWVKDVTVNPVIRIQQRVSYQVLWALAVTGLLAGTLSLMLANAIVFGTGAAMAIKTILALKRNA